MTQKNKNTPKKATKASTQKKTSAADTKWTPTIRPLPRVKSQLLEEVGPIMMREFNYSSVMEFPRLDKIVVNVGLGEALTNSRAVENTLRDIAMITGQNPVSTKAKKSIAGFKIREGMTIGVKVTLRRRRMYEFFDRLISLIAS